MNRWQRRARLTIAVFGVVFAVFVVGQLKRREPPALAKPVPRTDPTAVVETLAGHTTHSTGNREDVSITSQRRSVYEDGSSKLQGGVTIVFDERAGDRTFTITGNEGRLGKAAATMAIDGAVKLVGSDGMTVLTEHATYAESDGVVRAPGPVEVTRGKLHATGIGMTWEKTPDVLTILDQAVVHIAAENAADGPSDVAAATAVLARREKYLRFERAVRMLRGGQIIEAESAIMHLSDDEKRVQNIELHEHARITASKASPGGLQAMNGGQINLTYAPDGESLQHALVAGNASIQIAGEAGKPGRQIAATTIDIALAPDGSTPTALLGRENVLLTFPPEPGIAGRTIHAATLDAKGEAAKGLTRAMFSGGVQYRERGGDVDRAVNSGTLDVGLKPAMSAIDDAKFAQSVKFEEAKMAAQAAAAHYDIDKGTLALSGREPAMLVPHVVTEQIAVDAVTIDVTLAGPKLKAAGNVRSTLKPASAKPGEQANDVKMPAMLKQDQPVLVVGENMDYDGASSKGTYTGSARLIQGDTSVKGDSIVIDNKAGNLGAAGNVVTTTVLEQKDKKKERAISTATAKDFTYDDATRRMTYTKDAHMRGPEGEMTAVRIELFLKPSGDELDRAEAYESVVLREQSRETKGSKLVYTTDNETYVVTGTPVKIVDQCQRETIGRTLTFNKGADSIVVDGNTQIRTQTKGGNGNCTS
jgi:LPS export ABC transporter protein LptC/lipopolysaccharide transport protein LptA